MRVETKYKAKLIAKLIGWLALGFAAIYLLFEGLWYGAWTTPRDYARGTYNLVVAGLLIQYLGIERDHLRAAIKVAEKL